MRTATHWPPADIEYQRLFLSPAKTDSVRSLNDGSLVTEPPAPHFEATRYCYPDPGWRVDNVGYDGTGRPDPVRRVITFTSAPLEHDVEIGGPSVLVLYASSTATDTDFILKLSEQYTGTQADATADANPRYQVVSKGWLRASHRELDESRSKPGAPYYKHEAPSPLRPNEIYRFEIAIMPTAHRFKAGNRIRLELANADSAITEYVFTHEYSPRKVGTDSLYHDAERPSHLLLPVRNAV